MSRAVWERLIGVAGVSVVALGAGHVAVASDLVLPPDPVLADVVYTPLGDSLYQITLIDVPPGYSVSNQAYNGWCLEDNNRPTYFYVPLWAPDDPNLPLELATYQNPAVPLISSGQLPLGAPVPWGSLHYLLNHRQGTMNDVQAALWTLMWGESHTYTYTATAAALVAEAQAHPNYVPLPGEVQAAILFADGFGPDGYQDAVIELEVPEEPFLGALGDFAWFDADEDGVQDAGEAPVPGVKATLHEVGLDGQCGSADDMILGSQLTDASGHYLFDGLAAGTYCVVFQPPAGFDLTQPFQGGNVALDSDADLVTGQSGNVTLSAGQVNLTVDVGLVPVETCVDADADGWSDCNRDCRDDDASINPGAAEVCDGVDNDCDGLIDEGFDADGDGFTVCEGDCDESDPNVFPGAYESCDGIDSDCDGQVDGGLEGAGSQLAVGYKEGLVSVAQSASGLTTPIYSGGAVLDTGLGGVTTVAYNPADGWLYVGTGEGDDSLYRVLPASGTVEKLGAFDGHNSNLQGMDFAPPAAAAFGFEPGGLYGVSIDGFGTCTPNCLFKIDAATGASTALGALAANQIRGVSFSPVTGALWVYDPGGKVLSTVTADAVMTRQFVVPDSHFDSGTGVDSVFSLAHACNGELFAYDMAYGVLVWIDVKTQQAYWLSAFGSAASAGGSFQGQGLDAMDDGICQCVAPEPEPTPAPEPTPVPEATPVPQPLIGGQPVDDSSRETAISCQQGAPAPVGQSLLGLLGLSLLATLRRRKQ